MELGEPEEANGQLYKIKECEKGKSISDCYSISSLPRLVKYHVLPGFIARSKANQKFNQKQAEFQLVFIPEL